MLGRLPSAFVGAVVVAAAFPVTRHLAAESWSPGAVGLWLLLALPGLALLVGATRLIKPLWLVPLAPVGVGLLGLDVTDSARPGVVTAGYAVAVLGAVAGAATAVALRRRRPAAAQGL